jgi:hypothetical protein
MFNIDAQQALGFIVSQTAYIEPVVLETEYPDIQYPDLIPVDTSAPEWAKSVTYYSTNKVGRANWFHHYAKDVHVADIERSMFEVGIDMAEIGYRWTLEEIGNAVMTGMNLTAERAIAARRAADEFIDKVALQGAPEKNFPGLINYPGITSVAAPADGTSGEDAWTSKTSDQIMRDINMLITGMWTASGSVELANTLLLPLEAMSALATSRVSGTVMTTLAWVLANNVYTNVTGQPFVVRAVRGLESAGPGGTGRAVAYRRDPGVLKMHIPMPHRFLPVWQTGPLVFDVPGIFRLAGLEIRRPGAVRYMDGITNAYHS